MSQGMYDGNGVTEDNYGNYQPKQKRKPFQPRHKQKNFQSKEKSKENFQPKGNGNVREEIPHERIITGPRNQVSSDQIIYIERPITGVMTDKYGNLRFTYDRNFGSGGRAFPDGSGPAEIVASRPCIVDGKPVGRLFVRAVVGKDTKYAWPQDIHGVDANLGIPVKGEYCLSREEARRKCILAQAALSTAITIGEILEDQKIEADDKELVEYATKFNKSSDEVLKETTFDAIFEDLEDAVSEFQANRQNSEEEAWQRMGG